MSVLLVGDFRGGLLVNISKVALDSRSKLELISPWRLG